MEMKTFGPSQEDG